TGLSVLGSRRGADARYRTMDEAIRWSAELLPAEARMLWRLLSVFRGGFTVAASVRRAEMLGRARIAAELPRLLTASLVRQISVQGEAPRFSMLEPVRMVAAEELAASGEVRRVMDAHAAYFSAAAVAASGLHMGPGGGEGEARAFFSGERANLLAALDHLLNTGQVAAALPLAVALGFWWEHEGTLKDGFVWLSRVIAADDGAGAARDRWLVRSIAALLALQGGDPGEVRRLAAAALEIARAAGDEEGEAMAEVLLGCWQQTFSEDHARAMERLNRALLLAQSAFDRDPGAWLPLAFGANLRATYRFYSEGETEQSLADFETSIETFRAHGSVTLLGMPMVNMAAVLQVLGRRSEAMERVEEALQLSRAYDQPLVQVNAAMRMASLLSEEPGREAAVAS
ncbi:MAG: hypothetical protein ACR2J8_14090, partial [Thermomicrobiales bacterium]